MPKTRTIPPMKLAASKVDFRSGCEVGVRVVLVAPAMKTKRRILNERHGYLQFPDPPGHQVCHELNSINRVFLSQVL